ncbi:MAG: methyl-coenzyme M reductase operon protein D [Methanomethylophilus sp.]
MKPTADYANVPLPEVRILTNRLLSAETTEKVLNALDVIEHIRQINMNGENLPAVINSGPAKGIANDHTERRLIHVGNQEVELHCLVGAFFLELEVDSNEMLESVMEEVRKVCDATIKDGYSLEIGMYSKYRPSLNDYRSA